MDLATLVDTKYLNKENATQEGRENFVKLCITIFYIC